MAMAGGIRASPRFPRRPSCLAWAWCAGGGSAIPCSSCPGVVTTASLGQTADQNAVSHALPHPNTVTPTFRDQSLGLGADDMRQAVPAAPTLRDDRWARLTADGMVHPEQPHRPRVVRG